MIFNLFTKAGSGPRDGETSFDELKRAVERGLIHPWCKLLSCNGIIRARSNSRPARPDIAHLRVFNLLIWPSVCPLLQGCITAFRTAS